MRRLRAVFFYVKSQAEHVLVPLVVNGTKNVIENKHVKSTKENKTNKLNLVHRQVCHNYTEEIA